MTSELCGAPTRSGAPCRWRKEQCRHHQGESNAPGERPREHPLPPGRDLRELGWWLIENVASRDLSNQQGSVIANVMRVLAALGPEEDDEESGSRVFELQARLSMGFPPRNTEEWVLAERLYDPEAIREFRRWEPLEEVDRGDGGDPLDGVDALAREGGVAAFTQDED